MKQQLEKANKSLKKAEEELVAAEDKARELEAEKQRLEEEIVVMSAMIEQIEQVQSKKESEAGGRQFFSSL